MFIIFFTCVNPSKVRGPEAVSYTHLDVYKRQDLISYNVILHFNNPLHCAYYRTWLSSDWFLFASSMEWTVAHDWRHTSQWASFLKDDHDYERRSVLTFLVITDNDWKRTRYSNKNKQFEEFTYVQGSYVCRKIMRVCKKWTCCKALMLGIQTDRFQSLVSYRIMFHWMGHGSSRQGKMLSLIHI